MYNNYKKNYLMYLYSYISVYLYSYLSIYACTLVVNIYQLIKIFCYTIYIMLT